MKEGNNFRICYILMKIKKLYLVKMLLCFLQSAEKLCSISWNNLWGKILYKKFICGVIQFFCYGAENRANFLLTIEMFIFITIYIHVYIHFSFYHYQINIFYNYFCSFVKHCISLLSYIFYLYYLIYFWFHKLCSEVIHLLEIIWHV